MFYKQTLIDTKCTRCGHRGMLEHSDYIIYCPNCGGLQSASDELLYSYENSYDYLSEDSSYKKFLKNNFEYEI